MECAAGVRGLSYIIASIISTTIVPVNRYAPVRAAACVVGLFAAWLAPPVFTASAQTTAPVSASADNEGVVQALFVEEEIALDGLLDEPAWRSAAPVSGFRQYEPVDGAPAFQETEVRVLYGANHLYVGALLHDDEPGAIEKALGRRDDFNRADWFLVAVDAYFDRRTAYVFGVNAAGVQFDAIQTGTSGAGGGPGGGGGGGGQGGGGGSNTPRGMDPSWDAVWYSDARVTQDGWVAEMRIPYSMLRFSEAPAQTWGIHFTRRIPRLGEQSEWPHVPRIQRTNLVAQFGRLEGIRNVKPRRNVQIIPYTVAGVNTLESEEVAGKRASSRTFDVGGDLKIGLGTNVTLDAAINPDFGQVEADPAVLNLTAFETFFQERRPFFVEGFNIYDFSVGPGRLLYTRRIGADAPIIGAGKLSGRTGSGLSFGVLGAATGSDFRPSRGYGVGRASQQLGSWSSAGGIVTLFEGADAGEEGNRLRSLAAGMDWDLRFLQNRYGVEGFFSVTNRNQVDTDIAAETGFASKVWLRKRQGALNGFAGLDVFSDAFDPNDTGQLRENNFIALISSGTYSVRGGRPFGPFQRGGARIFFVQQFSYREGLDLGQQFDFGSRWTFQNFQSMILGFEYENPFGGYDLYETRGLSPWSPPGSFAVQGQFQTDERRNWRIEPGLDLTFYGNGGAESEISFEGQWNASDRLSLSTEIEGEWERDVLAWSANETFLRSGAGWFVGEDAAHPDDLDAGDFEAFDDQGTLDALLAGVDPTAPNQYYASVFGERDTRSTDITVRGTFTLTPRLSVQLYSQIFAARGRYDRFRLHRDRDNLADFNAYPKRDEFAFSSLHSNLVLRWEYRPGSALFVVWTHGRNAEDVLNPLSPASVSPYDRSMSDQFGDTFEAFPENAFLIKLNYNFLN